MSDFKAKMHQTPLGELTALPRPLSWIKGDLLLRGGDVGMEGNGGKGRGREGKGREGRAPPIFYCTPSSSFPEMCLAVTVEATPRSLNNALLQWWHFRSWYFSWTVTNLHILHKLAKLHDMAKRSNESDVCKSCKGLDDGKHASCQICGEKLSCRGGSTSALRNHLRLLHRSVSNVQIQILSL